MRFMTRNYFHRAVLTLTFAATFVWPAFAAETAPIPNLSMGTLVQFRTAVVRTRSGCQQASEVRWEDHPQRGWRFHQSDLEAARRRGREKKGRTGAKRHCYTQSPQPMSAGTASVRIEYSTRHANHTAEGRSHSAVPFGPSGAPRAHERAPF